MRPGESDVGRSNERGQASVEIALTLPVVLVLALVIVQAGLVAKDVILVNHAAREAARAAAVEPTQTVALRAAEAGANLESARLTVSLAGGRARGDTATATVRYASPTDVPLIGWMVGDVWLSASVSMRVE